MLFGRPTASQTNGLSLDPNAPVAYFCAEYGISDAIPIYSGGLGVLAGDIVQENAERNHPFVSIGLLYKKGYFHQYVDCAGQNESPQLIDPLHVPLELMKGADGETLLLEIPVHERTVYAQAWRYKLANDHSLYLLDTDHWKNSEYDRAITDQLYGGDQIKRIHQELVLAFGGFRLLNFLGITPALYHMNEGHSAFLVFELISRAMKEEKLSFEDAKAKVKGMMIFTNHTLVPAGNDMFPHDMIRYYLGKYAYDTGIGIDNILALGYNNVKPDTFSMTMAAMRAAGKSNAVSKLHATKAKDLWPEFSLEAVTNGVHLSAWVANEWQELWDTHLPEWRAETANPKVWKKIQSIPAAAIWQTHRELKGRMLDEVYGRTGIRLDEDTLTIVWARRFATYKRPDLLFSDLERLKKLLFDEDTPIQIIVAGKAHPADVQGKQIIEHIDYLANYQLKHRAVFVDDYSISLSRYLVSGADIWLNTPVFGLEASGTSGMKASANGVIQCTVPDGWANEVDWYGLGYSLPIDHTGEEMYALFEKKIIPTYYRLSPQGVPELWVSMMKETIRTISPQFSSTRMVNQYIHQMYLPLLKKQSVKP
jgi:starch phosphorylase